MFFLHNPLVIKLSATLKTSDINHQATVSMTDFLFGENTTRTRL